jgi:hypothetical protein
MPRRLYSVSVALVRARAVPIAAERTYCQRVRIAFCALMAALGLAAGFAAGCQDNPEDSPPTSSATATATLVYEMSVGESTLIETCIYDENGRHCFPGGYP